MRYIVICMLLLSGTSAVFGQAKLGVTAGYILSTFEDSDGRTFESEEVRGRLYSQSSVYAGVFRENPINNKSFMKLELNYIVAGGMQEAHITNPSVSFLSRVEFHQLQFPVSYNYLLFDKLSIHAGLAVNVNINARYKFVFFSIPAFPQSLNIDMEKELSKEVNKHLVPVNLGIFGGAAYPLSRRFGMTARYNYLFTNMSSRQNDRLHMHFLQAGISYKIIE